MDLEYCLHRVSFVLPSFYSVMLILIDCVTSQTLAPLERRHEKRGAELALMAKIMELEVVTRSQADKITELEATCANLKHGKDKLTDSYRRLVAKHKSLEQDMAKPAEAHATELTKHHDDFDLETHSYIEYHQDVRHWLCELHEVVASSFDKVKACCMPFPDKGVKVEEMIDWVVGEVKAVPDTVW
jgi:uncharacterized coiled-coil protein SlyX